MRYYLIYGKFKRENNLTRNEYRLAESLEALTLKSGKYWAVYSKDTLIEVTRLPKKNFERILEKFIANDVIRLFSNGYRINPFMLYNGDLNKQNNDYKKYLGPKTFKAETLDEFFNRAAIDSEEELQEDLINA